MMLALKIMANAVGMCVIEFFSFRYLTLCLPFISKSDGRFVRNGKKNTHTFFFFIFDSSVFIELVKPSDLRQHLMKKKKRHKNLCRIETLAIRPPSTVF